MIVNICSSMKILPSRETMLPREFLVKNLVKCVKANILKSKKSCVCQRPCKKEKSSNCPWENHSLEYNFGWKFHFWMKFSFSVKRPGKTEKQVTNPGPNIMCVFAVQPEQKRVFLESDIIVRRIYHYIDNMMPPKCDKYIEHWFINDCQSPVSKDE